MPVTDITKDVDTRTLTITAEFAAPVERVWSLYEDPRQLEQVWGPPDYPATFVDHDLRPGSRTTYFMTSPEGEKFAGYWDITGVEQRRRFTFRDGFAHEDLTPEPRPPRLGERLRLRVRPAAAPERCTRAPTTRAEALQTVLDMGMEEGARSSINQIDGFLAQNATPR